MQCALVEFDIKGQMNQNLDNFSSAILKSQNVKQNISMKLMREFFFLSREKE